MPLMFLALVGFLIFYGSLYPFDFRTPPPHAWDLLWSNWQWFTSRGDVLGNVLLFVPLGLASYLVLRPQRPSAAAAALLTFMLGAVLSLIAQLAQLWTPARDPALADVIWNVVGTMLGIVGARLVLARIALPTAERERSVALALLGLWVISELLPLVPSLDFQLLKVNVRSALGGPLLSFGAFAPRIGFAMLAAELLHRMGPPMRSPLVLATLVGSVAVLRVFMVGADMALSIPLGLVVGAGLWLGIAQLRSRQRALLIFTVLLLGYTLEALAPFRLREMPSTFSWLPFAALLEGSMLTNLRALLATVTVAAGCLYLLRSAGLRLLAPTLGLALWVLLLELLQLSIQTRTADLTPVLLVLLVGTLITRLPLAAIDRLGSRDQTAHTLTGTAKTLVRFHSTAIDPDLNLRLTLATGMHRVDSVTGNPWPTTTLRIGISAVLIAGAMHLMLSLPGMPYNVLELFSYNGSVPVLLCFALALLWIGVGAVWLAQRLAMAVQPGLVLWPTALAVSLISLALLWTSVTTESLHDIIGSSDLFRAVTQDNLWGSSMRDFFLLSDARKTIAFLDRCVRYAALYAPLPILLASAIAVRARLRQPALQNGLWAASLSIGMLLMLGLCERVAFAWAATDNLTSLIATPGPLGIGGGAYLYLLLGLVSLNALSIAWAARRGAAQRIAASVSTLLALPLGWWLLNMGLDPAVEQYGSVFSGIQFLLGPDRAHIMTDSELVLRWTVVQLSAVLIIASGVWLGQSAVAARAPRLGASRLAVDPHRLDRSGRPA